MDLVVAIASVAACGSVLAAAVSVANRYRPRPTPSAQPWTLEPAGPRVKKTDRHSGMFRLTNRTGGHASTVSVETSGEPNLLKEAGPWDGIHPGGAVEFLLIQPWGEETPTLTVRWMDPRGRQREWFTVAPT